MKSPDYDSIAILLSGEDWTPMETMGADNAAIYLETKIIRAQDEVAPVMKKKVSVKKITQWSTSGIVTSTKTSYMLYKEVKDGNLLKEEYKNYKRILQRVIRKAKNGYYDKRITDVGYDTRKIWGIVNEVIDRKQSRQANPATFTFRGRNL